MKILIINGSPKGGYSTTLHTCLYLQKKYPEHEYEVLHAGKSVKALQKDFSPAVEAISKAELIIFSYPVYTFLAPSQLHIFISLMKAAQRDGRLDPGGKVVTQVTTSKHFYDITAHRYIEDNCADMGLAFIDGLSADMDDLLTEKGRKEAEDWFSLTLWNISKGYFKNPSAEPYDFSPVRAEYPDLAQVMPFERESSEPKRVVIVADWKEDDIQLRAMVSRFKARLPYECDVVNIEEFPFMGGCVSCFNCATTGKCIYKDGFDTFLRENIHKHDAIVYAFRISDHSMGTRFKIYDDRQFCNGHRTVTMGTPFAYLISGALSKEENLRTVIEARAQVGGNFLAGVATDETDPCAEIDRLADTLKHVLASGHSCPQNFYGIGGMKIFRDLIYMMRGMMRADHKFFKSHGQYDFPQKKFGTSMKMYLVGALLGNAKLRAKMGSKMNEGMIKPYREVVDQA
ncbi:MAG: NAD(P)H-dependent oxidoreductase [Bacteroidia bacterium]|nr:NAD(P)H-dependent oxidoreductase [Bacteroidia bacterium]